MRIPWRKNPEGIVVTFSEPVMEAVTTFVTVAGPRLLRVRSLRDLKALGTDRELIKALATDLEPLVEGVLTHAIAHPLPIHHQWAGHASVSVASAVGAGAGTSAEIATIFAPEAVGLSIPTALTIQVVSFTAEQLKNAPADSIEALTKDDGRAFRDRAFTHYGTKPYWH